MEGDLLHRERPRARGGGERGRIGGFDDRGDRGEDLIDALHRRRPALHQAHRPPEGDHRPDELGEVEPEGDEGPDGDLAGHHLTAADPEDDDRPPAGQEAEGRVEHPRDLDQREVPSLILLGEPHELRRFGALLPVGAHDPDAAQVLDHVIGQHAEVGLDRLGAFVDPAAEPDHDHRQHGERDEDPEGEAEAGRRHHRDEEDGQHERVDQIHQCGPGHHPDVLEIVGGAGDEIAAGVPVEEGGRLPLQMGEEGVAQVGLDPAAGAVEQLPHHVPADAAEERHHHQQQEPAIQLIARSAGGDRVDAVLQKARHEGTECVRPHNGYQPEEVGRVIRTKEGPHGGERLHYLVSSPGHGAGTSHLWRDG